ncbi:MAG: hypothetical protein JWM59_4008 [Verrucomicrobiales bacterium]|nr:hypothetical protein [Verrucomicrobiales bacterium]
MKPPLIQRLKARLLVSGHKKQQGVAILTVLAIITLMTVLVVSFFNMAQSAQATAKGSVEIQRVSTLKDTVINLVIAQFREASRLAPSNPEKPRDIVTWTSQPGAIRTYSSTERTKNKVFKLYSSNVPQISDIGPGDSSALLRQINNDVVPDWGEKPDEFTDLNRPVYTSATGDRASASGRQDDEGYSYPIADPRAYNGKPSDRLVNTEGFSYSNQSLTKTMRGVDAQKGQLAMPVRWIYQLQDGTLGYLDDSREFTSLSGRDGGEVSKTNPIVGRMAWWADDESCKINVNTASVPAIWDTPRTTSKEDVWLANTQPLAGEYQRYPGHPATVDLSAVLFPGRRYTGTDGSWVMSPGEHMPGKLSDAEANLIWDLAPFIVGDTASIAGTQGGVKPTPVAGTTVTFEGDDHLFTSLDEVYFKASAAKNPSLDTARENLSTQNKDPRGELLERLERAQFFLTHKSHSPELTNTGFPRVSMYPMDTDASPYVNSTSSSKPPNTVSPYDITMAVNSTIGKRAYYFQRKDPNSRHGEFYSTSGATDPARNSNVFKYIKELARLPIAGYPVGFAGSQPFVLTPSLAEDPNGTSLASKYPSGYNPATNARYKDSNINVKNGQSLMDASDRTQILLNMLDYTRSLNMQAVFVDPSKRYDGGNGQATGVCGCGNDWGTNHGAALLYTNNNYRVPKGAGKLLAPAEIAMIVNIAATKSGTATTGDWNGLAGLIPNNSPSKNVANDNDSAGVRYMVEVGFVMAGFNPKLGWAPVQPNVGIYVSTVAGTNADPISPAPGASPAAMAQAMAKGDVLPLHINVDGSQEEALRLCSNRLASSGTNTTRKTPNGLIPYGGLQGPRIAMSTGGAPTGFNIAMCAPICLRQGDGLAGSVNVDLRVDSNSVVRILTLDGPPDFYNVTAGVDLKLPSNFASQMQVPVSNVRLNQQAVAWTAAAPGAATSFPGNCVVRSLVVPHGDYRLCTSMRMDSDMFVAHSGYVGSPRSYSFYEAASDPGKRQMAGARYSPTTIINSKEVTGYSTPGSGRPMTSLPLPLVDAADMAAKESSVLTGTGTSTITSKDTVKKVDNDILEYASMDTTRRNTFAFGRRDGRGVLAKRGSSDPDETGDFDNGTGAAEDGPYMNHPDEGDRRKNGGTRYFTKLTEARKASDEKAAQNISPNFLIRSPVDFGSIPSGLQARVPWQTLRFRPDPGMNNPQLTMTAPNSQPPVGRPFANFCGPRDHFFLDIFWMPVVEPYSISEPFSTKGTINLNQQIFPFLYIERTTALHALLRGERMLAIPNAAADQYKRVSSSGEPNSADDTYRHFLNVPETVRQFTQRYNTGTDPEGFNLAFNTFRSASEICEVWLVPDKNGNSYDGVREWDLPWTIGTVTKTGRQGFWEQHRLTGDNSRERPYANLYPRVTVRSNVFKLHIVAQTLQKARSTDAKSFNAIEDLVTAEWRGSCLIERSADSRDPSLNTVDYTTLDAETIKLPRVENYYTYRVTEVKQLTQ